MDTGTVRYFHAALPLPEGPGRPPALKDTAVAQIAADFMWLAGRSYAEGSYHAAVNVAVTLTGILGATSAAWRTVTISPLAGQPQYPTAEFRGRLRTAAEQLLSERCDIAHSTASGGVAPCDTRGWVPGSASAEVGLSPSFRWRSLHWVRTVHRPVTIDDLVNLCCVLLTGFGEYAGNSLLTGRVLENPAKQAQRQPFGEAGDLLSDLE